MNRNKKMITSKSTLSSKHKIRASPMHFPLPPLSLLLSLPSDRTTAKPIPKMMLNVTKLLMPEISKLKPNINQSEKNSPSLVSPYFNIAFIVTYDVTISVYHTEKIGELADQLLKAGVSEIESFEWASTEEDDSE